MSDYVYVGAVDPASVRTNVVPSDAIPDLAVVTGASYSVSRYSTGQIETWSAEIVSQSSTALQARHGLTADDTAYTDRLRMVLILETPGGPVHCRPFVFRVRPVA